MIIERITRETSIIDLPLSTRIKRSLSYHAVGGDKTLGGYLDRGLWWRVLYMPNFGARSLAQLKAVLENAGLLE